jgi:uncharacterized protein YbjT (DUF2867 family)
VTGEQIMTTPILVTGGTGTLGRLVVPRLRQAYGPVRVLSRHSGDVPGDLAAGDLATGDLATGDGVDRALAGVHTVLHLAGSQKGDDRKATTLVRAARRAGVGHIVYISVTGADRVPVASAADRAMFGYFAAKRAAEEIIASSGIGWTTLRATQFHELVLLTATAMAKLPLIPVPAGAKAQPVAAAEVADRLVDLVLGGPAGLVPDLGGPEVRELGEFIRSYVRATGKHRGYLPVRLPGKAAAAFRDGANLTLPGATLGRVTWAEFLSSRVRQPA